MAEESFSDKLKGFTSSISKIKERKAALEAEKFLLLKTKEKLLLRMKELNVSNSKDLVEKLEKVRLEIEALMVQAKTELEKYESSLTSKPQKNEVIPQTNVGQVTNTNFSSIDEL